MKNLITAIVVCATVLLCVACGDKSTEPDIPPIPTPKPTMTLDTFDLDFGESVEVVGTDLSVSFDTIYHDSRCPEGYDCPWEGWALAGFDLSISDTLVGLSTSAAHGWPYYGYPDKCAVVPPYSIHLFNLLPNPPPDTSQPPEYTAQLAVLPLDQSDTIMPPVLLTDLSRDILEIDPVLFIGGVGVVGDTLKMKVYYEGGCDPHDFVLFMSPQSFSGDSPAQATLYLRHWANNDPCRSVLGDDLVFDLSPVNELYRELVNGDGDIRLKIYEPHENHSVRITYNLPD